MYAACRRFSTSSNKDLTKVSTRDSGKELSKVPSNTISESQHAEETQAQPGHLGTLTPEEERKLQEAWVHLLRLSAVEGSKDHSAPDKSEALEAELDAESLAGFRPALWNLFLADHPDVMILRFLRARKWDVDRAMGMLVSNMHWRHEHKIDEEIVAKGDTVALSDEQSKDDKELMDQFRSGKAYVRGTDRNGRPVFIIRVKLHELNVQSNEVMERFVLHNIETIKMMMRHPNEKACLIFDLTGFGLKNMDFHVVKFLAQTFEARYPEYLGVVLVHNAPFVFWGKYYSISHYGRPRMLTSDKGAWAVIKPWLDPVIASKIHFTSGAKGLLDFIDKSNLQKFFGGEDTWEYKYIAPTPGENNRMQSEKKDNARAERDELVAQFESLTLEWAELDPTSEEGKEKAAGRSALAGKLGDSFWKLDPYVRARTYYHRAGVIDEQGKVNYQAS